MMNRNKTFIIAAICAAISCFGIGCGGDEPVEPTRPVVRNTPKAKPRPKAKTITELHSSMSIDDRILMEELYAPRDEKSRVAILEFFDAMLNVDATTLQGLLSYQDQIEFQSMVEAGLASYMQRVSMVQLTTGTSPDGKSCVLALFEVGLDYQIQVWFYENKGDGFSFEAAPTRPNLVNKLNGDWVVNYFEQRERQIEIANQPDIGASYTMAGETTTSDDLDSGSTEPTPGPKGPSGPSQPGK
jgi:hypothetical protein